MRRIVAVTGSPMYSKHSPWYILLIFCIIFYIWLISCCTRVLNPPQPLPTKTYTNNPFFVCSYENASYCYNEKLNLCSLPYCIHINGQLMHDAHRADVICDFSNNNSVHYVIYCFRDPYTSNHFTLGHRDDVLYFMNDSFVASVGWL